MTIKTYVTKLTFDTKSKKGIVVENFPLPDEVDNYTTEKNTIEETDEMIAQELIKQGYTDEKPFNIFVDDLYGVNEKGEYI